MRTPFLLVLIGLTAALVANLHFWLKPRPSAEELQAISRGMSTRNEWQGKLAPDFELVTSRGAHFKLSENLGKKVIVLNFFATWCGPCRTEMPELNRYFQEHQKDPFLLLAIDSEEKPDVVRDYFAENKLTFPVAIDDGPIQKQFNVTGLPTTILIGVEGRVQLYEAGGLDNADVAFNALLGLNEKLLASGKGIAQEAYLRELSAASQPKTATGTKSEAYVLDARGKRIATNMDCPCGCDKRVDPCECHTSNKIKQALAAGGFGKKSDAEIIRELDKKYCMAGM
jgi:thiol-disulfide isomerase/thioredoxin